jgi:hypothetical protein
MPPQYTNHCLPLFGNEMTPRLNEGFDAHYTGVTDLKAISDAAAILQTVDTLHGHHPNSKE